MHTDCAFSYHSGSTPHRGGAGGFGVDIWVIVVLYSLIVNVFSNSNLLSAVEFCTQFVHYNNIHECLCILLCMLLFILLYIQCSQFNDNAVHI